MTRTFDRRPSPPDERDYPAARLLAATTGTIETRNWRIVPRLDQGQEGACVGFSISHALGGYPHPMPVSDDSARALYEAAKRVDEWPGEDYQGSSVRAALKAARQSGSIVSYHRCAVPDEALLALSHHGPIVVGMWWPDEWMDTVGGQLPPWTDSGVGRNGHAICVHGYHAADDRVRWRQSWGESWGWKGDCFTSSLSLRDAIEHDGEAWTITKVAA